MKNVIFSWLVFVSVGISCSAVSAQTNVGYESQKLVASDGASYDVFGYCVSVSGDVAIIGAYGEDENGSSAGSAYIYRFDGSAWIEEVKLLASDGASYDYYGWDVSISGNRAIVGAYGDSNNGTDFGAAYIYRFDGTSWIEETKLLASDGAWNDAFGYSVSISGNTAIVGAYQNDDNGYDSGSAYIYHFDGKQWNEVTKLLASDGTSGARYGRAVCISGDTAIVGAYDETNYYTNSAYIYRFDGSSWNEELHFLARPTSVSISGNIAVANASGGALLFRYDGSTWVEEVQLSVSGSVNVSNDTLIIGNDQDDDNGTNAGAAHIYRYNGIEWVEDLKLLASDGTNNDRLGFSVSMSGNNVFVGGYGDDDNGSNSGSTYIFDVVADIDGDGVPDTSDNCYLYNPAQLDCNGNGIGDVCDVADATSFDCDWNGVPDECQSDCNHNGIADACDIAAGIEQDCNLNGIPDSCDIAEEFLERAKLVASNGWDGGGFGSGYGSRVSIFGNTAVVGSIIYRFSGVMWIEESELPIDGEVSISGDTIIVGDKGDDDNGINAGAAYIYQYDGTSWFEQTKLLASEGASGDRFGDSVSISGDFAVVGASFDDDNGSNSGSAYVFHFDGSVWVEQNKLIASDGATEDHYGISVANSGNIVVVGSSANFGNAGSGAVYVYSFSETGCTGEYKITPSDGGMNAFFGGSVSISGNVIIVGASGDDDNGFSSGSAYVFRREVCTWVEEAKLLPSDGAIGGSFGWSVSISGDTAIVGTYRYNSSDNGSAYVYRRDGNSWHEFPKLLASDGANGDQFGKGVAISGEVVIVGAPLDDDNGPNFGSVYIFGLSTPMESGDCNFNGIPDVCDLEDPANDQNGNGILDECECAGDANSDGLVDVTDLLIVIAQWGATASPADLNLDGIVNVSDLLLVADNWGSCQ